jgi:hypothetical protein
MMIIDRFEGNIAVVESGDERLEIPRGSITKSAKEGDVLVESAGAFHVDAEATAKRRAEVTAKLNKLTSR